MINLIVAKILLRTGKWKWKFIIRHKKTFVYNGCEYNLNHNCLYSENILLEPVRTIYYIQDNPNPILFNYDHGYEIQDTPINEFVEMGHRLRRSEKDDIMFYLIIGSCAFSGISLYLIYKIIIHLGIQL